MIASLMYSGSNDNYRNLGGYKVKREAMDKEFETSVSRDSIGLGFVTDIADHIGLFVLMTSHILSPV